MAECAKACDATKNCQYFTKSKATNISGQPMCGACFLSQHCDTTGKFVPSKASGDRGDTFVKAKATPVFLDGRPIEHVVVAPADEAEGGKWPRCGMATHGVNTAQVRVLVVVSGRTFQQENAESFARAAVLIA